MNSVEHSTGIKSESVYASRSKLVAQSYESGSTTESLNAATYSAQAKNERSRTKKIVVCLRRYLHFLQQDNEQLTMQDVAVTSAADNYLSSQEIPTFKNPEY